MAVQDIVDPPRPRPRYTVLAERVDFGAWHLTVGELPDTWTVAFTHDEIESRARHRIALDLGVAGTDFDIEIVERQTRPFLSGLLVLAAALTPMAWEAGRALS